VGTQISLLSSVYLQWTLWYENPSVVGSFSYLSGNCDWEIQAQNSFQLGADEVFVRCAKDITTDFCATFGINSAKISNPLTRKVNKTSGLEVITLLLRNRELRTGPHDSYMNFFLESLLAEIDFSPTPIKLKIDNKLSKDIEEHFRINNVKLIKRMSSDHAAFLNQN